MTLIVGSTASYVNADMGQVAFEAGYRSDNITFNRTTNDGTTTNEVNTKFKDLDFSISDSLEEQQLVVTSTDVLALTMVGF